MEKKIEIMSLLPLIDEPMLRFFDIDSDKMLDEKIKVFLKEVEEITYKENEVYGDKDLAELGEDITVTSEEIKETAAKINEKLAEINHLDDEKSKDVKKN